MKPFNEHGPVTITEMQPGDYALHGDVIVKAISELPEGFDSMSKEPMSAMAYGEQTGHVHQLDLANAANFDLRVDPVTKKRWLKLVTPTMLRHQEHSPIIFPSGLYEIDVQKEYDPFSKKLREVAD
jgi:hypothetical protein